MLYLLTSYYCYFISSWNRSCGAKSIDDIYRTGAKVMNVTSKKVKSMHAHEEDIKLVLSLLKPKYYMPIKGEFRHLVANAKIAMS